MEEALDLSFDRLLMMMMMMMMMMYQSQTWGNRQPGRQVGQRSSLPIVPALNKQTRVRKLPSSRMQLELESPPLVVLNKARGTNKAIVKCGNILCGM